MYVKLHGNALLYSCYFWTLFHNITLYGTLSAHFLGCKQLCLSNIDSSDVKTEFLFVQPLCISV